MKKTFKPSEIMSNRGCYDREQVEQLSFYTKKRVHIKNLFKSELPLKDAYWYLFKKCDLSLNQKLAHCLELAEIVLPIYEQKHPNDSRVRGCIEAVKKFNNGKIDRAELMRFAATAATAAYTPATYATYAAYAATYAAYASASAASAYSAYASAADAADSHFKDKLINATIKYIDEQ